MKSVLHITSITFKYPGKRSPLRSVVVAGPSPEELGPLLQGTSGRELGDMNLQQKDPCGGEGLPSSNTRGGGGGGTGTKPMSNPWHLLHSMRAMRITSHDSPVDSVDTPELQREEESSRKTQDNSIGVSWHHITTLWLLRDCWQAH